ncbi:hypothetical protein LSH36_36g06037 [Paralvinella palmiformis]|uniref:G-protein coupled receptors family 1 profile domain-containing protein n=1 Tax=Paralvinella palmiformis TaxID=53620 RepID=A0AAD9K903_9ANNE|nr:hypothetical protein LSH36_36g06037 [Paralvinella palmiformis]
METEILKSIDNDWLANASYARNGSYGEDSNRSCDHQGTALDIQFGRVEFLAPIAVLILFDLVVIFGNTLVILAVTTHVKLRTATNTFIISLAVADLLVGISVLPFSSANEVLRYWPFGMTWCSIWLAIDVWMCTASILSLCAISLDRYLAISRPFRYPRLMSQSRASILVTLVWVVSFLICFPPLIGWKDSKDGVGDGFTDRNATEHALREFRISGQSELSPLGYADPELIKADVTESPCIGPGVVVCELTSEPGYIIYSALGSFWIPVWIMGFFYWKIYRTAAKTTGAIRRGVLTTKAGHNSPDAEVTLRVHRGGASGESAKFKYKANERTASSCRHLGDTTASSGSLRNTGKTSPLHGNGYNHNNEERTERNGYFPGKMQPKVHVKLSRNLRNGIQTKCGERQPLKQAGNQECGRNYDDQDQTLTCTEDNASDTRPGSGFLNKVSRIQLKSHMRRMNKEKKAAKTVGIIVGCFIVCWAPFFTVYLLGAFCPGCTPSTLFTVFFWLGYCNSAVNPCLYAMCSKDFRYAFKKLLRCRLERRHIERRGTRFVNFLNSIRIQISTRGSDSISD